MNSKLSLITAAAIFSAGTLFAEPPADGPKPPPEPGKHERHFGPGGPSGKDHPMKERRHMRQFDRHGPEALDRILKLTPEQKEKFKEAMKAAKPKIDAIREEERAKIKAVMDETMGDFRSSLTPEQQAVLDSLKKLKADQENLDKSKEALDKSAPQADAPKPAE